MSSVTEGMRRSSAIVALLVGIAGCSSLRSHAGTSSSPGRELSKTEQVAHVLSRLTFGARSGDAERVAAMGVDRWIDEQLRPDAIPDSAVVVALASIQTWNQPATTVGLLPELPAAIRNAPVSMLRTDTSALATLKRVSMQLVAFRSLNDLFYAGKIIRAQVSDRQLLEVVSDFWENHFSVYSGKMPTQEALVVWDRDALRPRALGRFRDLLGATAHSPAMLFYLDNHLSTRRGLNENYARELLELHTLGADGGYTQHDVVDVARALTGWTYERRTGGQLTFVFRREQHDTGAKTVLGHTLPAGRGIEDGEDVLDLLAQHPSTARHIAFKLARRLVSDEPPPSLVTRAAATFTRTDGDIAEVVRTIVTSPEFFSRAAFRAKVKTPFELVVSARRALDASADTTLITTRLIAQLGQPAFGWQTPDGWPETGDAWMNSGALYKRLRLVSDIVRGNGVFMPLEKWHEWTTLSTLPLDRQVDGVVKSILSGSAEPATREAMLAVASEAATKGKGTDGTQPLRDMLAIALASPEFQRR